LERGWCAVPGRVRVAALPALLVGLSVLMLLDPPPYRTAPNVWAVALVVFMAVPLLWTHRAPIVALAASALPAVVYVSINFPGTVVYFAPIICLYNVGRRSQRRTTLAVGVAGACVVALLVLLGGTGLFTTHMLASIGLFSIPLIWGDTVQSRRAYVVELQQRLLAAEHGREEEAQRRVQEDRLSIARDLHDVVAHTVSAINIQAGVASHLAKTNPELVVPALDEITNASRDALAELRGLLGVLRSDGSSEDELLRPAPGLDRIATLVDELHDRALDIHLECHGIRPALIAEPVQVAAYRIVQEATTNVIRHARGAATDVVLHYLDDAIEIVVHNQPGATPHDDDRTNHDGSGVGLLGMRERAALVGGKIDAGPDLDGGFLVTAHLPYAAVR